MPAPRLVPTWRGALDSGFRRNDGCLGARGLLSGVRRTGRLLRPLPLGMEDAGLVGALVGVCPEVVALRLDQVGG